MAVFSNMMGKEKPLPWINRSQNIDADKVTYDAISPDLIQRFRAENALDYLIYDYCIEKFRRLSARHVGHPSHVSTSDK